MAYTRLNPKATAYEATWTADSSNANGTPLTGSITLPAGTYVIVMTYPVISTGTFASGLALTNGTPIGAIYHVGIGQSSKAVIMSPVSEISVRMQSAQSDACSFSYKERGSLKAVKLA